MSFTNYEDIKVWQKSHQLVLKIYKITKFFPPEEQYGLTNQIRRSAVSIGANIVEGYKKTNKDFKRYLDISRGSLEETKYHLQLSKDLGYCSFNDFEKLKSDIHDVGGMLYNLKMKL